MKDVESERLKVERKKIKKNACGNKKSYYIYKGD